MPSTHVIPLSLARDHKEGNDVKELKEYLKGAKRVLILGMGNEDRGDDSFGILTIRELRRRALPSNVKLLEVGISLESFLGKILEERPSHVIFLDATEFGGSPGEIILADPEKVKGRALSTHSIPLKVIVKYLKGRGLNAKYLLIGCQPKDLALFSPPSREVIEASKKVALLIFKALSSFSS